MKKLILIAITILTFQITNAQLNANAKFFKEKSSKLYNPIKDAAVKEWGTDNAMVVYMINKQCDALNKLMAVSPYQEYVDSEKNTPKGKFFTEVFLEWTTGTFTDYAMVVYKIKNREKNSNF